MTDFESAVMARGDDIRQRIDNAADFISRLPVNSTRRAEHKKVLALYKDLLAVIERHERIAQLATVLATECA